MAEARQEAYCTLLMSDAYLPGAMVLARSLRDNGTKKQLAIMVTLDTLRASTINELQSVYDVLIPVDRITNKSPANLYLMQRPDLGSTFTKIALWRQTQFTKIVYLDADMVALRAPDELFEEKSSFAAAPDIGWPDCFNSGLLVLSPNMGDYYALLALAQRGISFDGADQGMLNMHFRDWHRLSFTYNCTPSGNYQYVPAYRHFQSSISVVHFIGNDKPWLIGRESNGTSGVYEELLGRWWAVYDKYYRAAATAYISGQSHPQSRIIQQYVKNEASISDFGFSSVSIPTVPTDVTPSVARESEGTIDIPEKPTTKNLQPEHFETEPERAVEQRHFSAEWDPLHQPPPQDSRPEASEFPNVTYDMSEDRKLFQPPASYPEPPKGMYYEVPTTPPAPQRPKQIFPWEARQPKAKRVFPDDPPSVTASSPESPATPTIQVTSSEPFANYSMSNAWDEMPEIERYVANLPHHRRSKVQVNHDTTTSNSSRDQVLSPTTEDPPSGTQRRRPSMKLTDFPTEVERPSLPVTPAAVRRPSFWGKERDAAGDLPPAEGVPEQSEWEPSERIDQLRRQSEIFAASPTTSGRVIPERSMVESSVPLTAVDERPKVSPSASSASGEATLAQEETGQIEQKFESKEDSAQNSA